MGEKKPEEGFHKYKTGRRGHHFEKVFLKIPFFLNDASLTYILLQWTNNIYVVYNAYQRYLH